MVTPATLGDRNKLVKQYTKIIDKITNISDEELGKLIIRVFIAGSLGIIAMYNKQSSKDTTIKPIGPNVKQLTLFKEFVLFSI